MVQPDVAFTYRLTGPGWSKAEFRIRGASVALSASYLDDALGDLVRAVATLPSIGTTLRVSWAEEPGEYRWVFDSTSETVSVRLLEFAELWGGKPDEEGQVLMAETCPVRSLRRAIAAGARAVLDEWGEVGYRQKWGEHDFPTAALSLLEADPRDERRPETSTRGRTTPAPRTRHDDPHG